MSYSVITTFLSSAAAATATATVTATSGNILLAFVWADSSYGTDAPKTDYNITGWTKIDGNVNWVAGGAYWRTATATSADNVAVAFASSQSAGVYVVQFTDANTSTPINQHIMTLPANATTMTITAPGATDTANEYIFAFFAEYIFDATYTAGSATYTNSFANVGTQPQHFTSGDADTAWLAAKTVSATETPSTTITVGSATVDNPIAILVSVRIAGAAAAAIQEQPFVVPSPAVTRSAVW
jgi:hypothetical protein